MTTQQDSVDVERLRVRLVASALCRATGMDPNGGARTGYGWRDHEKDAIELLAALSLPITQRGEQGDQDGETLESIVAWGDQTFGPCTAERAVGRGCEELEEAAKEQPGTPEHAVEIADTIICFLRVPGIVDAINAKMAINRARRWNVRPDGTGYHIKGTSA